MFNISSPLGNYKWRPQWDITTPLLEWLKNKDEKKEIEAVLSASELCGAIANLMQNGLVTVENSLAVF